MAAQTAGQRQAGIAAAIMGGGAVFTSLGIVFDDGIGPTFSLVGVFLIVAGAVLLGKAAKMLKEDREDGNT